MTEPKTKCGFVALIGEPNAGKSTLMNKMVGAKVSIVTHKVQTTRARIRGIAMAPNTQIVFVDTPGLFRTRRKLDKAMVAAAWTGAADADVVVLLVEAHRGITKGVEMILDGLQTRIGGKQKIALAINKIDKVKSEVLLELTESLNEKFPFEQTFMISAEKGFGVKGLEQYLCDVLPEGPYLYPEDQIADVPMRMLAAEVTREKLMLRLHQELPYALTVETEHWNERKDGSVRIDQVIYVAREGHKGITVGPKGEGIKTVSMMARKELAEMMGREVHLFLQVKVRPNWENEQERYTEMGLDFKDTK
ncbi:GTPase Era [Amylibacter kogurei]|uniref:GTPase Era n=1 Tax=Paramylibacter kogurei TaxID=1889778 RepID=A0A2G5K167_9RHOB|nr:GTPase Era [Amylibacter kogurei]PIB23261.1 GTPase Era [Amylibacter kogurei]